VAEGLDSSGKSARIAQLGRWLEQRGHVVRVIDWAPSKAVERAAADPRLRIALTPRVAALIGASEAQGRIAARITRRLRDGQVVLAERYAWTAIAREVARGLDLEWVSNLHRAMPPPDLVLYQRSSAQLAVARALADRPPSVQSTAVASAYGEFAGRLAATFELLVERTQQGIAAPWPTDLLVLDEADPGESARTAWDAVLSLVEGPNGGRAV